MTGHTPWREIKHKRDLRAAAAESGIRPFRGQIEFCFAEPDEGDVLERAIAALESIGVFPQTSSVEPMSVEDVIPGSPLAQLLSSEKPPAA